MSDEETKRNRQTKSRRKKITTPIAMIISALIGFFGGIIQQQCANKPEKPKVLDLAITLRDADTGKRIAGYVFIDDAAIGTFIDTVETPPNIPLVQGRYTIRAVSDEHVNVIAYIDHIGAPIAIPMQKMQPAKESDDEPPESEPVSTVPEPIPLSMSGWYTWGGVTVTGGATSNECIINNRGRLPDAAGIVNEHLGSAQGQRILETPLKRRVLFYVRRGKTWKKEKEAAGVSYR